MPQGSRFGVRLPIQSLSTAIYPVNQVIKFKKQQLQQQQQRNMLSHQQKQHFTDLEIVRGGSE
ncbi:hypothetical protein [Candidatus Paracaedibacter symbiosus]|uniref:hypothetical protein n=1 Tax=Candidatus Paracaedibacter symbiosus TaxID=244582 RepID=UPI0012EB8237|nr:hypothetical protein [Candidatus Paracaedibacter symbiosus]